MTVQARIRKSSRPAVTNASIRRSICSRSSTVAERIPEKRGQIVLAISEVRLWIDRYEAPALSKDVVMVEVAVHKPVGRRIELGEELACERNELTTLALRPIEPTRDLGRPPVEMAIPHAAIALFTDPFHRASLRASGRAKKTRHSPAPASSHLTS
jgi:hypothetical protein